jgi:hypothetical protein
MRGEIKRIKAQELPQRNSGYPFRSRVNVSYLLDV